MTQSNTTGHETQSENMQDSPMMAFDICHGHNLTLHSSQWYISNLHV